jgi:hypothetical protein
MRTYRLGRSVLIGLAMVAVPAMLATLAMQAACASASKVPVFGTWEITSYSSPGGAAAPASVPALAWVGVSASFERGDARFGEERCSAPKYTSRSLSAAEFQQEFRVPVTALGITGDPVIVYKVDCGTGWAGKADTFIVKSPTALVASWNGSFLEMVKTPAALK